MSNTTASILGIEGANESTFPTSHFDLMHFCLRVSKVTPIVITANLETLSNNQIQRSYSIPIQWIASLGFVPQGVKYNGIEPCLCSSFFILQNRPRSDNGNSLSRRSMFRMTTIRFTTCCLIVYWLVLFVATHLPRHSMPKFLVWDKLLHWGAFLVLAFLIACVNPVRGRFHRHFWFVFGVTTVYGIADELTQQFTPGRVCDFWDAVANSIGALSGLIAFHLVRQVVGARFPNLSWLRDPMERT